MKIKRVSGATMNPLHMYMSLDKSKIYRVVKMYGGLNTTIAIYKVTDYLPKYCEYELDEYIHVKENNPVIDAIDLGIKPYYTCKNNVIMFSDIDKGIEKFNRFISLFN